MSERYLYSSKKKPEMRGFEPGSAGLEAASLPYEPSHLMFFHYMSFVMSINKKINLNVDVYSLKVLRCQRILTINKFQNQDQLYHHKTT